MKLKKKILFAALVVVSLLCSCEKKENPIVDETPDKLVINLEAPFSYKSSDGTEYKTSFDDLKVKAVVKIDNEIIPQAVTASNGFPWKFEKEVSLEGKTSISFELYPEFSLKDENNLPEKIYLGFTPKGSFTFYKNGNVVSADNISVSWGNVGVSIKAKEKGLDIVKQTFENQKNRGTSKAKITW